RAVRVDKPGEGGFITTLQAVDQPSLGGAIPRFERHGHFVPNACYRHVTSPIPAGVSRSARSGVETPSAGSRLASAIPLRVLASEVATRNAGDPKRRERDPPSQESPQRRQTQQAGSSPRSRHQSRLASSHLRSEIPLKVRNGRRGQAGGASVPWYCRPVRRRRASP